jgi:hypothetical protein
MDTSTDLSEAGSLFADDAYIRKEYVELYDLIRTELAKKQWGKSAIVRGSSGTGKSAFLQYVISRIRDEVRDVLVVQGQSHNHNQIRYLHLSTTWWGQKIATKIKTYEDACEVEKNCSWTVVDGCDWTPANNFTIGAASPSTPWKGFLKANCLELCMPLWPLDQLQDCLRQKSSENTVIKLKTLDENFELIGGIARWAFSETSSVVQQVSSAVLRINFETLQAMMTTKNNFDAKELVHRLVEWGTPIDEDGKQTYIVTAGNPIHFRLLSRYASKKLATKAATLSLDKRKSLISDLKGEWSAASAYRGAIFEAYAIDRLICGGNFQLRKCTTNPSTPQEVTLTLPNTSRRYTMAGLHNLGVLGALDQIIVPDARNFESTDAFCVSYTSRFPDDNYDDSEDNDHYVTLQFQMTVGESHPTKLNGIKKIFQTVKDGLPADSEVTSAFIYVVPDDGRDSYLAPQSVPTVDGSPAVFSDRNQYRLVIDY